MRNYARKVVSPIRGFGGVRQVPKPMSVKLRNFLSVLLMASDTQFLNQSWDTLRRSGLRLLRNTSCAWPLRHHIQKPLLRLAWANVGAQQINRMETLRGKFTDPSCVWV